MILRGAKKTRLQARSQPLPWLRDGQPIFANHSDNGLRFRCKKCQAILDPHENTQKTIRRFGNPFDTNDPLHWVCDVCGHSGRPSEWLSFHELRQGDLFSQDAPASPLVPPA